MCAELTMLPGGYAVAALSGDIDVVSAPAVRRTLAEAVRAAVTGVIVDLGEVTFMDAAGLGVLAAAARASHLPDRLRLVAVPPRTLLLLKLTRLDGHLSAFSAPRRSPGSCRAPRATCRSASWLTFGAAG